MSIKAEIISILHTIREDAPKEAFDENLFEIGILDSLGMAQLIPALETKFCIKIALDDIDPDNFATVDAITNFVETNRSGC